VLLGVVRMFLADLDISWMIIMLDVISYRAHITGLTSSVQ
jgi:hypothetical protein